jgi:hypothetical protein
MPPLNDKGKNGQKKEKKFFRFFLPALLAVLVHLAFFGFKRAIPPDNPDKAKPKRVMLLPHNTVIFEEQKLLAWLEILDPTYFIQPNRKHGFSRTFNAVDMEDIPISLKGNVVGYNNRKASFIDVPWKPKFEIIKDQWEYTPRGIKFIDFSIYQKNIDFPVWMTEESSVLPQLFGNIDKLKATLKKVPPEFQETVLKVDFFGPNFFPKVEIVHSCGTPELDTFAMRTLIVKGKLLGINDKDSSEPYFITVKWYSKD